METGEPRHMPSLDEKMEMGSATARLREIRTSVENLDRQLVEAKAAADVTPEGEKREDLLDDIDELEEALEHLREEETELQQHLADDGGAKEAA